VILKADEQSTVNTRREFSDRATFASARDDIDQTEPLVFVITFDTERQSEDLQSGTDREHVRAVAHARTEGRRSQQIDGEALRSVLSPAQQIQRGVRDGVAKSHTHQLRVDTSATSSLENSETVAPVAVRAQEFGVDSANRCHGCDLANQS
jgi:hypothetical protein